MGTRKQDRLPRLWAVRALIEIVAQGILLRDKSAADLPRGRRREKTASHREASRASGCWSMSTAKEPASIGSATVSPTGEFVTSLPKPGHFTTATCDDAIWRRCLVNGRLCDILHIGLCSIAANHICLADTVLVGQHDVELATSTFR